MNAQQIINRLEAEEVDSRNAPDMRRVLRDQRLGLMSALQTKRISSDQIERALEVARMWGVKI